MSVVKIHSLIGEVLAVSREFWSQSIAMKRLTTPRESAKCLLYFWRTRSKHAPMEPWSFVIGLEEVA
jgi:hypothetical protein